MMYTQSYQMYRHEHGLHFSAAEQRAADAVTLPVRFLSSVR